ncbi:hypothetical protein ACJVC5_11710 [Peredibacter sp. HCB2-198]|uniref:hypothetical protein n=1 Tax=Peredibacter sp. HCB2-198 TaxID=3383025 RepID=UPI0038B642DA
MEHRYLKTTIGKIHAAIVVPSMLFCFLIFCYEFAQGKNPNLWGMIVSLIGFALFLKAKRSVIRKGKLISFGCDLMDQKNTNFYFSGWVLFIAGYFLSWV